MIGRLLSALDRMPMWARRGVVIVFPLLLFGALVAGFALAPVDGGISARRPPVADHLFPPAVESPAAASGASHLGTFPTPPPRHARLVLNPDRPVPPSSPLRRMLATARSFANVYVLYEIGRLPGWVRHTILATCTSAFARYLFLQPAHLAGVYASHPLDVEFDRVVSVSFAGEESVEVSYVAEQNIADTGAFLVKLARRGGRWLVASVGL